MTKRRLTVTVILIAGIILGLMAGSFAQASGPVFVPPHIIQGPHVADTMLRAEQLSRQAQRDDASDLGGVAIPETGMQSPVQGCHEVKGNDRTQFVCSGAE